MNASSPPASPYWLPPSTSIISVPHSAMPTIGSESRVIAVNAFWTMALKRGSPASSRASSGRSVTITKLGNANRTSNAL